MLFQWQLQMEASFCCHYIVADGSATNMFQLPLGDVNSLLLMMNIHGMKLAADDVVQFPEIHNYVHRPNISESYGHNI